MTVILRSTVAVLALAGASAALAQVPPASASAGLPANPYARPYELAPNDKAADTAAEQMRRGLQETSDAAAAKKARSGGRARPAKAEELTAGAPVSDSGGRPVGTIEAVEADGVVVVASGAKVKVPAEAFGINRNGLLLGISKDEFDKLVVSASESPAG